jgi:hypothetical protein
MPADQRVAAAEKEAGGRCSGRSKKRFYVSNLADDTKVGAQTIVRTRR